MRLPPSWILPLASVVLTVGTTACSGPKSSSALPAQATAPTITVPPSQPEKSEARKQTSAESTGFTQQQLATSSPVDAVTELIARVDKEYQTGIDHQRAGRLDAARKSFNQAFELLLMSKFDVHSDDRLEQECDRLLEGIHSVEIAVAPEVDAPEQKSEPAPIDEANEVTYPVDANVKAKAEAEIKSTASDLPLMMTDQVAGYISYFSSRGHATIANALVRSGRYEDMIRRILKEEGVPQDLIYLAQAESGFHPLALSRAGARGMWQFMGSRAKGYGLERNFWMD